MNPALNPNLSPVELKEYAKHHPLEVMQNLALPLVLLEDPGWWERIEQDWAWLWVCTFEKNLHWSARELYATDCTEYVATAYETICPGDLRLKQAIATHRAYVLGHGEQKDWLRAQTAVGEAAMELRDCADLADRFEQSMWAAFYAADSAYATGPMVGYGVRSAYRAVPAYDGLWFWRRLLLYLQVAPRLPTPYTQKEGETL